MEERNLNYFVSDVHLGLRAADREAIEKKFLRFLQTLPPQTKALYLLGDIFDFWYEYKYVIPREHTRVLGALAALKDSGVDIFYINGNHDIWTYDYFQSELGIVFLKQPSVVNISGKIFCLGHGDGLGKVPFGYRVLRGIFHSRFCQVLFSSLHPRFALGFGYSWSRHTRLAKTGENKEYKFKGTEEPIFRFADDFGKGQHIDYFIFGHFHTPAHEMIPSGGEMFILGEWIHNCDYILFDGTIPKRLHFE